MWDMPSQGAEEEGEAVSQRASFVTEYMYCDRCADAVTVVLCAERHKYLCATRIPRWINDGVSIEEGQPVETLPIVAGKIGGLYIGEEFQAFEFELNDQLSAVVCHPVTIAVIGDSCGVDVRIFRIEPKAKT